MAGKLYGIGVGPGDPELLTLKALKKIRECDIIAVPGSDPKKAVAYQIAEGAYAEIAEKEQIGIPMPMTKDERELKSSHEAGVRTLCECLETGKDVAFLTLGDPTVYSTYIYLQNGVRTRGYETEIISGIPSFCAAAAKLNMGIAEKEEQIHIIPASYSVEDALKLPGTKVLMKAGKKIDRVKEYLRGCREDGGGKVFVSAVENCGMQQERIYRSVEEIPEEAGYYTLIIVKEKEQEKEE